MEQKQNIEQAISDIFKGGTTGTGEEELLRVASKYSMQLTSAQMKCLLYIKWWADITPDRLTGHALNTFIQKYLEFKEYNNSAGFIMRIIDFISLRRFLTEQSFKVDIQK